MAIHGVLFDFSGTLMRIEPAVSWLRVALERTGVALPEEEVRRLAAALEEVGALPGGSRPRQVPPELAGLWRERDRDGSRHRELYTALARRVPLPDDRLYDVLYDRHREPGAWRRYPDVLPVLRALRERGTGIGLISNIGWDLRPVLREHGLFGCLDVCVLSFEHGVQKPDARLFRLACEGLGLAPEHVLMVGDDERADGGATALGCAVHLVRHLPVGERPEDLRPVLDLVG
ncbi:HAD family hydrolase [Streptomyces hoynatensis]|uniref:HAD family hydrolase n=1 Tax=Streptomyces hoynatensis TaxID=1141874 RepID=A0A3A9YRB8_9ACTN|nr:HAD family hydrolase [Streptomyces hoynatensis]RKN38562.1 HAD family hydrolase [Streptomyces hoynatensis]